MKYRDWMWFLLLLLVFTLMSWNNAHAYHSNVVPHYAFYVGTIPDIGTKRKLIIGSVMGLGKCRQLIREIHRYYDKTTASYAAFRCIEVKRDRT